MWNEAVEVIEATEAVEAGEVIEATDIPRPGKSLLSIPESSRLFYVDVLKTIIFSEFIKYHLLVIAPFLLEADEASLC